MSASLRESRDRIRTDILRRKSDEAWRQFVRAVMARAKVNHEIAEEAETSGVENSLETLEKEAAEDS